MTSADKELLVNKDVALARTYSRSNIIGEPPTSQSSAIFDPQDLHATTTGRPDVWRDCDDQSLWNIVGSAPFLELSNASQRSCICSNRQLLCHHRPAVKLTRLWDRIYALCCARSHVPRHFVNVGLRTNFALQTVKKKKSAVESANTLPSLGWMHISVSVAPFFRDYPSVRLVLSPGPLCAALPRVRTRHLFGRHIATYTTTCIELHEQRLSHPLDLARTHLPLPAPRTPLATGCQTAWLEWKPDSVCRTPRQCCGHPSWLFLPGTANPAMSDEEFQKFTRTC
ncbi:hypothetical protein EXIGLDRAFT_722386 [Exidia glandulosa HHB12029]|uniref:Uncharacterized protein n=1 Tax=Exidia glandulosa HHB12029 TaxID=1314781 RepID=A0A165FBL2_EXIGL|nr:hypothetical protein EXIGLDRAFT_722386 [Exidia glandulosa HHB12029]